MPCVSSLNTSATTLKAPPSGTCLPILHTHIDINDTSEGNTTIYYYLKSTFKTTLWATHLTPFKWKLNSNWNFWKNLANTWICQKSCMHFWSHMSKSHNVNGFQDFPCKYCMSPHPPLTSWGKKVPSAGGGYVKNCSQFVRLKCSIYQFTTTDIHRNNFLSLWCMRTHNQLQVL